eukprot:481735_1
MTLYIYTQLVIRIHLNHFFRNYCLSLSFNIRTDAIICYLWWGIYQKLRFFPEMVVTVIPRLFNKKFFGQKQSERIKLIHSNTFKNGFGVNLQDDEFDRSYKKYTSYSHISNNYDRSRINKVNMDESKEAFKGQCTESTELNHCVYIQSMIQILKANKVFNKSIDDKLTKKLQRNYDHIIRAHGLFKDRKTKEKISKYIIERIDQGKYCQYADKCSIMTQHINTKTENIHHYGGLDSLFSFLQNYLNETQSNQLKIWLIAEEYDSDAIKCDLLGNIFEANIYEQLPDKHFIKLVKQHLNIYDESDNNIESLLLFLKDHLVSEYKLQKLQSWCLDNEYDTDCIVHDVEDGCTHSNLYQHVLQDKNEIKLVSTHLVMMNPLEYDDFEESIAMRLFNSIHTYLLHPKHELYRTKNRLVNSRLRFVAEVQVQEDENDNENDESFKRKEIYEVDFGQNVLQWLPYNENPAFNNFEMEIIHNPLSTVDLERYSEYHRKCTLICDALREDKDKDCQYADIGLYELMSLKLYTDTTQYQSALRRAFWVNARQEMKRNFYHWALWLYKAFQRYSQPAAAYTNELYHGLNKVFAIDSSVPQYNGIFSTTTNISVANSFSENSGVLWEIHASYTNPFKLVLGIPSHWFSNFKNEYEFIVFNSRIPIGKVRNFVQTDEEYIAILLKQLQIYKKQIVNKKLFYKNCGFGNVSKIPNRWKHYILQNRKADLFVATAFEGYSILYRLINELEIWNDTPFGKILSKKHQLDIQSTFGFASLQLRLDEKNDEFYDDFVQCEYITNIDMEKIYKCNDTISIQNVTQDIKVYVRNNKIFQNDNIFLLISKYEVNKFNRIDKDCDWTKYLQVSSEKIELNIKPTEAKNQLDHQLFSVSSEHCGEDNDVHEKILNAQYIVKGSYFGGSTSEVHTLLNTDVYKFEDFNSFSFNLKNNKLRPWKYHIYVSPSNYDDFHLLKHPSLYNIIPSKIINMSSMEIDINVKVPIWDKKTKTGGVIQIYSAETLTINNDGVINASSCGYTYDELEDSISSETIQTKDDGQLTFGKHESKHYDSPELNLLYYGNPGDVSDADSYWDSFKRGGGVIELIADQIINYGKIVCNGCGFSSGGSIKIKCKIFVNKGIIEATTTTENTIFDICDIEAKREFRYGRIAIICEQYKNEGTICPSPYINYTKNIHVKDNIDFTQIAYHNTNTENNENDHELDLT